LLPTDFKSVASTNFATRAVLRWASTSHDFKELGGQIRAARSIHDQYRKWEWVMQFYWLFYPLFTRLRRRYEIAKKLC
jgi:hypothetical protein